MKVQRATFEEVNKAQLELIFDIIQKAIDLNGCIDSESRRNYFHILAFALVGKISEYDFIFNYKGDEYNLGKLSFYAREMAFFDEKEPEIELKGQKVKVSIKELWKSLRTNIYKPMDEALTLALRSSAEIIGGGGASYHIKSGTKQSGNRETST